ncbi:TPA_asm: hypothetical protein GIO55_14195 [Listeria monocytogenes]|nr:hypothetical protein [Listeria monocytogenes]
MMQEKKARSWYYEFFLREIRLLVIFLVLSLCIAPSVIYLYIFIKNSSLDQANANILSLFLQPVVSIKTCVNDGTLSYLYYLLQGGMCFYFLAQSYKIFKYTRKNIVEDASKYGAYGTARFLSPKELFDSENFVSQVDPDNFGTIYGTVNKKEVIRKSDSRINGMTMVVSGSGGGKSEGFAIPNIIRNKTNSLVALDAKLQLYQRTSKQKKKEGFKVILLDFVRFDSNRWNPLNTLDADSVDSFSSKLVKAVDDKDDIWTSQGTNYISACIMYVLEYFEKPLQTMPEVRRLANLSEEELKDTFEELEQGSVAKEYFDDVKGATGNTWMGIKSTVNAALRFWKQANIRKFTEVSDFDFTDLGKEKIALYIRIHPTDKTFQPLVNLFFNQLFNVLITEADTVDGTYPVSINFDLDEFANIGKIENIQNVITYTRQLGFNIRAIVQDLAQLDAIYKKETRRTIVSSCDTFLFMGTNETETAKEITEQLGETTKRIRNESEKQLNLDPNSYQKNYMQRQLLTKAEVLSFDNTYSLLKINGKSTAKVKKEFAYKVYPEYNELAQKNWHIAMNK